MPRRKSSSEPQPLTGKDLLAKVKELSSLKKSEKAIACGYVKLLDDGRERAQLSEFMNALLAAKGINLEGEISSKPGPRLSYRASVHQNGQIIIGAGYTKELNLNVGDRFEIKLGRKIIKLTAIDEFDDDAID